MIRYKGIFGLVLIIFTIIHLSTWTVSAGGILESLSETARTHIEHTILGDNTQDPGSPKNEISDGRGKGTSHTSAGSGKGTAHISTITPVLIYPNLDIKSNLTTVKRSCNLHIEYNLSNPSEINLRNFSVSHEIPSYFETYAANGCNISSSQLLTFNCTNLKASENKCFGYSATITNRAPVPKEAGGVLYYSLNSSNPPIISFDNGAKEKLKPSEWTAIKILNKEPCINRTCTRIEHLDEPLSHHDYTYLLSRSHKVIFLGYAEDIEDPENELNYEWTYELDGNVQTARNNESRSFPRGQIKNITFKVTDTNYDFDIYTLDEILEVGYEDRKEWFYYTVIPLILFVIFLIIFLAFLKEKCANNFRCLRLMFGIFLLYMILYFREQVVGGTIFTTSGVAELFILALCIVYTNTFVVNIISEDMSSDSGKGAYNIFLNYIIYILIIILVQYAIEVPTIMIWSIMGIPVGLIIASLTDIYIDKDNDLEKLASFSRKIKRAVSIENTMNSFKIWKIWYFSIILMVTLVAVLMILVPEISTADKTIDTPYNHIFYYYSMMTQTFGAIVAIFAMISTSTGTTAKPKMKTKVMHFMILYISIILLSITGLAIRTFPPLDQHVPCGIYNIIPVFIFESTILLAIPALICLVVLILELYESKLRENTEPQTSIDSEETDPYVKGMSDLSPKR